MTINNQDVDIDPQETADWKESIEAIIEAEGVDRAHFIIENLIATARVNGANLPYSSNTAYINTIPTHLETPNPGNQAIESRIRSFIRWNAAAMVVRANRKASELGGHIASFASSAPVASLAVAASFASSPAFAASSSSTAVPFSSSDRARGASLGSSLSFGASFLFEFLAAHSTSSIFHSGKFRRGVFYLHRS